MLQEQFIRIVLKGIVRQFVFSRKIMTGRAKAYFFRHNGTHTLNLKEVL